MDRRVFLGTVASGLLAAPLVVEAQQAAKVARIGYLAVDAVPDRPEAFRQGLRDLGYVEGRNILIEYRDAEGKPERLPALAAELVTLQVDVILAPTTVAALAAAQATRTLPIVFAGASDPVTSGLVTSLARPGGNVTGLSILGPELVGKRLEVLTQAVPGDVILASGPEVTLQAARRATTTVPIVIVAVDFAPIARGYVATLAKPGGNVTGVVLRQIELTSKRMQFLKEALPNVTRVAVFWDAISADQWREAEKTALGVGLRLQGVELRNPPYHLTDAFRTAARGRAEALLLLMSPVFFPQRAQVAELGLKSHLPTICGLAQYAHAGAFMSYGANLDDMFRQAALYIDKIFKGARPADLPVEQPTKFELVINLKTAKALGLTIPPSLLQRADQIIE